MAEPARGHLEEAQRHHRAGRLAQAETAYRRLLEAEPTQPAALHGLGMLALQTGHPGPAADLIARAVRGEPDNPDYHLHLATALHALGRTEESEASLRRALEIAPDYGPTLFNLGQLLLETERPAEAKACFERCIALAPDNADALNALATTLIALGERDGAEPLLRKALESAPGHPFAARNLANFLFEAGRLEDAETEARALVEARPHDAESLALLARIRDRRGGPEEAVGLFREALARAPGLLEADVGLGVALINSDAAAEAVAHNRRLAEAHPDHAEIVGNLGLALKAAGAFADALECFDRALVLDPELADKRYMRGLTRMAMGDIREGLADYEYRWRRTDGDGTTRRDFPQAPWDGSGLAGERVLVWAEQGVGDHILFSGLLGLAQARGASPTMECDPRLVSLFARSLDGVRVVALGDPPDSALKGGDIAYQVSMGGLMAALAPWPEGFRPPRRFLEPDSAAREEWTRRLDDIARDRARIGISWRSTRFRVGAHKSMPLSEWGPILEGRDALFVNLQYGETADETEAAMAATGAEILTDPDLDRFDDIEGMMALIDGLDLVITTSNVTAHYAGALGKECWLALQRSPLWYWGTAGTGTLFYPAITAYRQTKAARWDDVAAALAADLDRFLAGR